MLTLSGVLRSAQQIGGGVNRKTGEVIPLRSVLQLEDVDDRGLVLLHTITVPDHAPYVGKVGEEVSIPVRAWAAGAAVNFSYAG
jgi:hypothetical protein